MSLKAIWKYSLKAARGVKQRAPIVTGSMVLATLNHGQDSKMNGSLAVLDVGSGAELWRFNTQHYLNEPTVSDDGFVYVTCFDGTVVKFDRDGNIIWRVQPSERNLWSGVVVGNHYVYAEIAGQSEYTRALNTDTGEVDWQYANGGHTYAIASDGDDRVVHSSVSGGFDKKTLQLHCLQASSGKPLWTAQHTEYLFRPLIVNEFVCVGSRGHLCLFSLIDGKLLDSYAIDEGVAASHTPIKVGDTIVFTTENGTLLCLEIEAFKRGIFRKQAFRFKRKWHADMADKVCGQPHYRDGLVIAIEDSGNLVTLDSHSGECIRRERIVGFKDSAGFTFCENDLIVTNAKECVRLTRKE